MNKWEQAKTLGLDPGRAVVSETDSEAEVVIDARNWRGLSKPTPTSQVETQCGTPGWKWYKCTTCPRFYNAPSKTSTGKCALCQFKALK